FSEWKRSVAARWLQIVLPVRGDEKLGEPCVFVRQIVLFLQSYAIHFLPYLLEELCRWSKTDEVNSGFRSRTHHAVGAELKRIFDRIEVLPEKENCSLGQTVAVDGGGVLIEAREELHLSVVTHHAMIFRVLLQFLLKCGGLRRLRWRKDFGPFGSARVEHPAQTPLVFQPIPTFQIEYDVGKVHHRAVREVAVRCLIGIARNCFETGQRALSEAVHMA